MRINNWERVEEHVNNLLQRARVSLKLNFEPTIKLNVSVTVKMMCENLWLILIDNQEMHIIHEDIENHLIFEDENHHDIVKIFRRL